ncbi:MAG: hypothetical protein H6Q20_2431 [Bacteroidetes bacterium]|nr:hypothetical protein [Bacteroidota bacterium]
MKSKKVIVFLEIWFIAQATYFVTAQNQPNDAEIAKKQHEAIGITEDTKSTYKATTHEDAKWFETVGFGMFIHWGICSVRTIDSSWPMMPGTQIAWNGYKYSQDSIDMYLKKGDYFAGHPCKKNNSCITPNEYWSLAQQFAPKHYNPDTWAKLAKAAGMKYMVLTTRHHDGFALWPSKFGNFSTLNYLNGTDYVASFVKACRKYGLKVGLYYSGPDWYVNRHFMTFLYPGIEKKYKNVPVLDANLQPVQRPWTEQQKQDHSDSMAVYIRGQVKELLTNYGKIDMIWFDGSPSISKSSWSKCISMKEIRELQPGIVVSPRFFGYGDFKTYEGDINLPTNKQSEWAELCSTVENGWGYTQAPLKPIDQLIEMLVLCRSVNTNFLLNFGPDKDGRFSTEMRSHLAILSVWIKKYGKAIDNCIALPDTETASVPATAKGNHRYLFVFKNYSKEVINYRSSLTIRKVVNLTTGNPLKFIKNKNGYDINVVFTKQTKFPQVIDVELS